MSERGARTKNIPFSPRVVYHPYTRKHYSQHTNNTIHVFVRSSDNIKKKTIEEKVDTEATNALNNSDTKPEPKKKSMGSKVSKIFSSIASKPISIY